MELDSSRGALREQNFATKVTNPRSWKGAINFLEIHAKVAAKHNIQAVFVQRKHCAINPKHEIRVSRMR